jgi:adenylate cyclase
MAPMRALAAHPLAALALLVLLAGAVEFGGAGVLRPAAHRFDDLLLRLHAAGERPDPAIVIVDIDERSLELMAPSAGRYPWSRSVPAALIEGIERQRPRAVVFDVLFSDPDADHPDGDAYLGEVAARYDNLFFPLLRLPPKQDPEGVDLDRFGGVLGFSRVGEGAAGARAALLLPYAAIAATGRLGAINFSEDGDGVGRRYRTRFDAGPWHIPSLPAKVASALGYALPPGAQMRLNWRGPALTFPRVSFVDIYQDLRRRRPRRAVDEFKDKIVLVGSTAAGLHDLRATPVGSLFPAVEIVATALDNLKHGDWLRPPPVGLGPALTLLFVGALYLAFVRLGNPVRVGLVLLVATPLAVGASYAGLSLNRLWPVFTPLAFAWLYYVPASLLSYLGERRARRRSIALFGRFLDPRVVRELVAGGIPQTALKGESREVTVLFSDIRGFTTLSERHSAEEVVGLLNDYFSRQVKVIFRHGGTIDKFIGDAIMAFWGAPLPDPAQARNAVAAGLEMVEELEAFRRTLGERGIAFDIGIGVHTGPAVVGFVGAENRLDYTAIGDTVNLASRIEGQTKGVARMLVSAHTRERCGEAFDFVDHGFYKVKGRTEPVRLYEPRGKR